MALLAALALPACAQISRKDVLVCGFPDGARFILTSKYTYSLFSLVAPVREHEHREGWKVFYSSSSGNTRLEAPTGFVYSNSRLSSLQEICMELGKRNDIVLVNVSYLLDNNQWFLGGSVIGKLIVPYVPFERHEKLKSELERFRLPRTTYEYAFIMPLKNGYLAYEQPLSEKVGNGYHDRIFDGVYQSFSTDNGKTWSDPVITTDALIFQMSKRWIDQCFVARPIEFNGDKIAPDFPEPCPPNP
jgi:hypothetical protein